MKQRGTAGAAMLTGLAMSLSLMGLFATPLAARDGPFPPPGWHAGRIRIEGGRRQSGSRRDSMRPASRSTVRALTINRRFDEGLRSADQAPAVTDDVGTSYGDIRTFNPYPYVTSGEQLPYGLDGIGGFGRDYGFAADEDASVYRRTP